MDIMIEPQIVCPNCRTEIKLTESLAAPLIEETRKRYEQKLASKESDFAKREAALRHNQDELAKAREAINDEVAKKLKAERASVAEAEAKKARLALANELEQKDRQVADLQKNLTDNNTKLGEAQKAQADVMRKSRELDDARRELDLSVEKKVQESLAAVRGQAKLEAEEGLKAKVTEKEVQIAGMQRQIEELRRKAEQGSQQIQGEALELELESILRDRFPRDLIEAVPKGEFFVGNGFDALLQGRYVVIAGHHGDGLVFEALGKMHGADGGTSLRLFKTFRQFQLRVTGGFHSLSRSGELVVGAHEYADLRRGDSSVHGLLPTAYFANKVRFARAKIRKFWCDGGPERSQTSDLRFRKPIDCPEELSKHRPI
jgi:hypothetical protein